MLSFDTGYTMVDLEEIMLFLEPYMLSISESMLYL